MPRVTQAARPADAGAPGVGDGPAADAALADALAAWRAHGAVAAAMIARLTALLDRLEGLDAGDAAAWQLGMTRYLGCRYGRALPRPLPPGAWPWPASLRGWEIAGWGVAVVARSRHHRLGKAAQARCVALHGPLRGADGSDHPLWAYGWPTAAHEALDRRAAHLGIDIMARGRLAHDDHRAMRARPAG